MATRRSGVTRLERKTNIYRARKYKSKFISVPTTNGPDRDAHWNSLMDVNANPPWTDSIHKQACSRKISIRGDFRFEPLYPYSRFFLPKNHLTVSLLFYPVTFFFFFLTTSFNKFVLNSFSVFALWRLWFLRLRSGVKVYSTLNNQTFWV